jgi:2-keto-4-pentenoate hydratase/2-oxohepta-3-ene-1,7-dioic acid hydratase in catechol pathway
MKIAQVFHGNRRILGAVQENKLLPFESHDSLSAIMEANGTPRVGKEDPLDLEEIRWAPVVQRPGKIIAIGLNYRDHAAESKGKLPDFPLIFAKFPSSLAGHKDEITWDQRITRKVDFEAELAVVIGKKVRNCPETEALHAVFGYTCANDVSARDLQFGDGQWVRGKSLDTFCPLGPWLVTRDEIPDPLDLAIRCRVNGELMQDSRTAKMIFSVPRLISLLSQHFTLFPGDIILSGTPAGVGAFREPPVYLKDGDEFAVEIDAIGRLVNTCHAVETR